MRRLLALSVAVWLFGGGQFIFRLPSSSAANPIAASRLPDGNATLPDSVWSNAGAPSINNVRTKCGSTIAAYGSSGSRQSASTITNAIAACSANTYVELGAGTFWLNSGIQFGTKNDITLRGQGADSTIINTTAGSGSYNAAISMQGTFIDKVGSSVGNVCDWTAGYAKGTTVITVANCGSTTPALGSLGNLSVGALLILDQLDETQDTGGIWNCAGDTNDLVSCANTVQSGSSRFNGTDNLSGKTCDNLPDFGGPGCLRTQQQVVRVTNINGSSITITPGLYMPNWNSSMKPQVWWNGTPRHGDGVEDVTIDVTNETGVDSPVHITNAYDCWVKGVKSMVAPRAHVAILWAHHITVRDGYMWQNNSHVTRDYGVEMNGGFDNLIENNIFHQGTDSNPSCNGSCAGNVIAYNFAIEDIYESTGWFQASFYLHAGGTSYNLWEGNIGPGFNSDQVHGTHHFETIFRNYLIGNQDAGCGGDFLATCTQQTIPVQIYSGSRYFNIVGNVLGQSGYHNQYQCKATSISSCSGAVTSIWVMGFTNNSGASDSTIEGYCSDAACSTRGAYDPNTHLTLFRWGNYDIVTGTGEGGTNDQTGVRWCGNSSNTGWTTRCSSTTEVPTGLSDYPNSVPATETLPASLYLSAKPSYFTTRGVPFPAIGPDVASGNISSVGGHANRNAAMDCYQTVMGGSANGLGGVLTFNRASCY